MKIDPAAFDRYRRMPNERTTFFRMVCGIVITLLFWLAATMAVIFAGSYAFLHSQSPESVPSGDDVGAFLGSAAGIFASLLSFAGIWLGLWFVMRLLHKENLSRLFGVSTRISRSGAAKGFAAVVLVSLVTEFAYLLVMPDIRRGQISVSMWLLLVLPLTLSAFVQTSAEELLFRGYLQRGLACRFRSPIVWAVLPSAVFTALHWSPQSPLAMNIGIMISIGVFSALLVLLVYATGNLGAAIGAHLGNNLVGFALISHQNTLGGLALFRGAPLDNLAWTSLQTGVIVSTSLASILLAGLLLLHPRSPFKVEPDLGAVQEIPPAGSRNDG